MAVDGMSCDPARGAALGQHPVDLGADDQPRAGGVGVAQPCLDNRLLRAHAAAERAVSALLALGAVADPSGHRVDVPAERHASLLELLLARRGVVVLLPDAEALAHGVKARVVFV